MELYKVVFSNGKKKFYESKKTFDQHWPNNLRYSKWYDVVVYKINCKEQDWKCIRRVGPDINYQSG